MYTVKNFKTKKALREAIEAGEKIRIFPPGLGTPRTDGPEFLEGPHHPARHTWYAQVMMEHGLVKKIIK